MKPKQKIKATPKIINYFQFDIKTVPLKTVALKTVPL